MLTTSEQAPVVAGIGDPGLEAGYDINDSISPWNGQSSDFFTNPARTGSFHVFPFLAVALARAQNMVEEFFLPDRSTLFQDGTTNPDCSDLARNSFARPLFPFLHKDSQRFSRELCTTEKMHVVRHDDIAPNCPSMAIVRIAPFRD